MLKKYLVILAILTFVLVALFAQEKMGVEEENIDMITYRKTGIAQLRETVGKLNTGMTIKEVEDLIGKPSFNTGGRYIPTYTFPGFEYLTLDYGFNNDKLISVRNKDKINLLASEYEANPAEFPVAIDGEEPITSNPVVIINKKVYVPIEDLAEQLGIEVKFNEEKQQLEIVTKK